ncbi:MAG: hypothetical protein WBB94_03650 [Candidatus Saccharimonadaceae bacterium]
MKLFCAYAFTGHDVDVVTKLMQLVVDTLSTEGHGVYCERFDSIATDMGDRGDMKALFTRVFDFIAKTDAVVVVVASPSRSVGQLMEIGVALSLKKPIYLFEHVSAKDSSYLSSLADKSFVWSSDKELTSQLKNV